MQKMGISPVGKVIIFCSLLQNATSDCTVISKEIDMEPPNIRDYFQ